MQPAILLLLIALRPAAAERLPMPIERLPLPAPPPKTCPCTASCECGCNQGGVCRCQVFPALPASPAYYPAIPSFAPVWGSGFRPPHAAPACGPGG